MTNTIISIGFLGGQTCYLNVSVEEALRRYKADNDWLDEGEAESMTRILHCDDEFKVYDLDDAKWVIPRD